MASSRTAAAAKAAKATKAEELKTSKKVAPKTAAKKEKVAPPAEKPAASRKRKADDSEVDVPKAKKSKAASEKPAPAATKSKPAAKKTNAKKSATVKKAEPKKAEPKKTESKKAEPKKVEPKKVEPKKTQPKKAAAPKKSATKKAAVSKKVEVSDDEDVEMEEAPAPKAPAARPKKVPVPKLPPPPKVRTAGPTINDMPSQRLEVFVFGEGSSGELGMGSKRRDGKKPVDVKRPRYNDLLSAKDTGVVQIACGGMHVAALTADGKMLTWGVNDDGALGRSTEWEGGLRDMDNEDDSDSDDEDDTGVNPMESTPTAVSTDVFIEGTQVSQVAACDSATFALTRDGRVYGWGTFRASDGILGFSETTKVQRTPVEIPGLKNITLLAAGSNHMLAVDIKGEITAWGSGEQAQLGRRIGERYKMKALQPQHVGIPKSKTNPIVKLACGSYHSFALNKEGGVYGWGLNNFGQVGVEGGAGEGDAMINSPSIIKSLSEYKIKDIAGGEHHSLACTHDGKLLVWGRIDGHQVGLAKEAYTEDNTVFDDNKRPRLLFKPTIVEGIPPIESVAAGTDTSFAVTTDGKVYTWGFSANYQTGLGTTDDIEEPTIIENSAIKEKRVIFAGAGGQYSLLCALPDNETLTNGTTKA
ncbi:Protein pim1 [Ceratocystis platani]|uniref:Protein pim1 n=1 Tax=Ceratocystis fimbriata f. sp. platani TaxID=88771 RepID=A0A0F8BNV8_CERFI|nr:Protein pim1 [Ceratocystis platani]